MQLLTNDKPKANQTDCEQFENGKCRCAVTQGAPQKKCVGFPKEEAIGSPAEKSMREQYVHDTIVIFF